MSRSDGMTVTRTGRRNFIETPALVNKNQNKRTDTTSTPRSRFNP